MDAIELRNQTEQNLFKRIDAKIQDAVKLCNCSIDIYKDIPGDELELQYRTKDMKEKIKQYYLKLGFKVENCSRSLIISKVKYIKISW